LPLEQIIVEVIKSWGPPGIIAALMFYFLKQSEKREAAKDLRIQFLENKLVETNDERIEAADRVAEAMNSNANAYNALLTELKGRRR